MILFLASAVLITVSPLPNAVTSSSSSVRNIVFEDDKRRKPFRVKTHNVIPKLNLNLLQKCSPWQSGTTILLLQIH